MLPSIQRVNYSLLISLCRLLITFANRLDQDQAGRNGRPDLGPTWHSDGPRWCSWKKNIEKVDLEKSADNKESMEILPGGKELMNTFF